jgi:hypothetical protein
MAEHGVSAGYGTGGVGSAGRGMSLAARFAACLAAGVLLGSVAFVGAAYADDDDRGADGVSQSRSDDDSPTGSDDSSSARPVRDSRASGSGGPGGSGHRAEQNLPDNIVKGTPCTDDTVACVSLGAQRAWLFKDGQISYGPVPVSTGGPGKQTPVGDHVVQWKHRDHTTDEFKTAQGKPAPMPFAVFFAEGGVAFHEGTLNRRSAGCVRLTRKDAEHFYNYLQLGDKVEVRG